MFWIRFSLHALETPGGTILCSYKKDVLNRKITSENHSLCVINPINYSLFILLQGLGGRGWQIKDKEELTHPEY